MHAPSPRHPARWPHLARRCAAVAIALAACAASFEAVAARADAAPSAPQIEALERAAAATVGLRIEATDDATSAQSLGRQREGSGVVIGDGGLILTIGYLLLEAQRIEIVTSDQKVLPARQVAYDLATGFGLVQPLVPLRGVRPVPLGRSASAAPGELVLVAAGGGAGGVGMTQLVSQRAFSGYWEYHIESALFTSPPVPNHSGAALFNQRGELLGIGSLFTTEAVPGHALPGNMFVPVDLLRPVLAEMQSTGSTRASRRPWLGLTSAERSGRVEILRVNRESPAEAAGLRSGDVVLAIDGAKVETLEAFYKKLWQHAEPESEVELTVQQGEAVRTLRLRAIDRMRTMRKPAGI